jgi:DNA-binding ferritin-like protein
MHKLNQLFDAKHFDAEFLFANDDSRCMAPETESDACIALLEELLGHSIRLRDLYKQARRQACDFEPDRLRRLFEDHYREQLRLVDVLMDRLRMLGGAGGVFAGDFLNPTRIAHPSRTRHARNRLLHELLEAHEVVLGAARPGGVDGQGDGAWFRDFAVGQVVLSNVLQSQSVSELFAGGGEEPRMPLPVALMPD